MIHKYKTSLKWKIALTSIVTLCSACFLSGGIIVTIFYHLYHGDITKEIISILILITCCLTVFLGGGALIYITKSITDPIIQVSEGVKQVARGDFTIEIDYSSKDEIGELAKNFNKMIKELNGMDYMRKDFMSNVSHEVKTPVAAISGFAEILYDGGLTKDEEQEYLLILNKESKRLSRLCDNMLKMSRLDNQVIINNTKEFYVDEQIRQVIILLEEKWTDMNIHFDLHLSTCRLVSDYDLLYQVWVNLIDNAIKFSHKKGIIYISSKEIDNCIEIVIRDNGVGIREDKIARVFDKFYQCDESHIKEGNGLGLAIVKRIVELLGGKINCISKEGKGSEFIVRL